MCNCINEIRNRIKTELPEKNPEYSKLNIIDVSCDNLGLLLDSPAHSVLSIPFTIEHEPVGRKKKTTLNMIAKYCPFCGQPYGKEGE